MNNLKERDIILKLAKDFSLREVEPLAAEIDETGDYPDELVQKLKDTGFLGCIFDKKYGGYDVDYLTYAKIVEEVSKYDVATGMIISGNCSLSAGPLSKYGNEEQKQKYLTKVCEEGMIMAFALTEAGAGSDASGIQTTAHLEGDEWVIDGTKIFISSAGIANLYVVLASTDKSKGSRGISAFLVEYPAKGFSIPGYENKMGIRGSHTGELVFENVRIPKGNLLGKLGQGFAIAMQALDGGRITVAASSVGLAQRALDESVKYSKERVQFGKSISRNQGVSFMLAEMETRLHAARLMTYDAAQKKAEGKPHSHEAAMAKLFASETANFVADKAVQIHGGYGYTKDYVVERLYRDAKILEIYEGTTEIQKIVIAAKLLKKK